MFRRSRISNLSKLFPKRCFLSITSRRCAGGVSTNRGLCTTYLAESNRSRCLHSSRFPIWKLRCDNEWFGDNHSQPTPYHIHHFRRRRILCWQQYIGDTEQFRIGCQLSTKVTQRQFRANYYRQEWPRPDLDQPDHDGYIWCHGYQCYNRVPAIDGCWCRIHAGINKPPANYFNQPDTTNHLLRRSIQLHHLQSQ